jgi:DNA-binding response OmpR family regulator
MMPEMNGWDVLKKIKTSPYWSKIPIVIISSVSDNTSILTSELIADDFIQKSFNQEKLLQKTDKLSTNNN